jgi:hypothetical protein
MGGKLKVHKVASDNGSKIGVEFTQKSSMSYHSIPVTLGKEQARRLAELLMQATTETGEYRAPRPS